MKKFLYIFILLFIVGWAQAQQRVVYTINDGWKFTKGSPFEAQLAGCDDSSWETVNIPHTWNNKDADVLCDLFADSVETGKRSSRLPSMRDSAIASEYAWTFLKDTRKHDLPAIGNLRTLEQIRERRKNMKNGYGLLHGNLPKIINP